MLEFALADIAELTNCYSNTAPAQSTYPGIDLSLGFKEQLHLFASGARLGINRPDVAAFLIANSADAPTKLTETTALVEFFWFLFSQKAWEQLLQTARAVKGLHRLPFNVADLIWLSFYRSQTNRLLKGTDKEGFSREAETMLIFFEHNWPNAHDRHALYAAMVAHISGHGVEVRDLFASLEPSEPLIEPLGAAQTVLLSNSKRLRAVYQFGAKTVMAPVQHVTLLSLDINYFKKFALYAARKFFSSNPGNGLHLHCVGFDPEADIIAWNLDGAIGWTADYTDLRQFSDRGKRGYYAAARYICLPYYLNFYNSVFIADVDGSMLRNLAEIDSEHVHEDVVLSTLVLDPGRQLNRLPWESITACAIMVRATPGGHCFAAAVGDYLVEVMRRAGTEGKPFWYADQTALYYTWFELRDEVRFGRFSSPPFKQAGSWKLFLGDTERLEFLGAKIVRV